MSSGLLDAITHGIGVAVSPLVIIVVVLILLSPRAVPNGLAFVAGWVAGLIILGAIIFALGGFGARGGAHPYEAPIKIVLGLLLLGFAVRIWFRGRARNESGGPNWMTAVDTFDVLKSAGAGLFFAAIYPKNLVLTATAAGELAKAASVGQQIALYVAFMVIGSVTIAGPILLYVALGQRIDPLLGRLKDWLSARSQAILSGILVVFGLKLLIEGIVKL